MDPGSQLHTNEEGIKSFEDTLTEIPKPKEKENEMGEEKQKTVSKMMELNQSNIFENRVLEGEERKSKVEEIFEEISQKFKKKDNKLYTQDSLKSR